MNNTAMNPIHQYRKLELQTSVANASPHQLVDMLFEGVRDRVNQAIGAVEREDHASRNEAINSAVDILSGLRASLDHDEGGELADNLEALYDYMQRRLFRANVENSATALVEVGDLISTLRSAWVAIDSPES